MKKKHYQIGSIILLLLFLGAWSLWGKGTISDQVNDNIGADSDKEEEVQKDDDTEISPPQNDDTINNQDSGNKLPSDEEEEIVYVDSEYEYEVDGEWESEQVYIDNGEIKEPTMQKFSAVYKYDGTEYTVEFEWFVHEEQLLLQGHDLDYGDDYIVIEQIPGCTQKVLISLAMRQDGHYGYQLCDLASNTIQPLLNGQFDNCISIQRIELLPDLSQGVVECRDGSIFYSDGSGIKDVLELVPQGEITIEHDCSVRLIEEGIVVMSFIRRDDGKRYMSCFLYDYTSAEVVKTVNEEELYDDNYNRRMAALRVHGGLYGTYYENDVMMILEYHSGKRIQTDVRYATVELIMLIEDKYFLILKRNKHVDIVHTKTGRVVGTTGPIDAVIRAYPSVIYADDAIYFEVTASDGLTKKIYKIEVDL